MSRWKAAGLHLLLSIAIITVVSAIVVWLWYPIALLHVAGIDRLIGLIAAVDITVGPLLTLIVYKHGKKGLKFDLTLIALVQFVLLGYGLHALSLKRPVFLVGVVDRLELVTANQIQDRDLAEAPPPYDRISWTGAVLVGAPLPEGSRERSDLLSDAFEGRDIHVRPVFFRPYESIGPLLARHALPVSQFLTHLTAEQARGVDNALGSHRADDAAVVPLSTANGAVSMLVDAHAGTPIAPVAIDYWKAMRQN